MCHFHQILLPHPPTTLPTPAYHPRQEGRGITTRSLKLEGTGLPYDNSSLLLYSCTLFHLRFQHFCRFTQKTQISPFSILANHIINFPISGPTFFSFNATWDDISLYRCLVDGLNRRYILTPSSQREPKPSARNTKVQIQLPETL